MADIFVRCRTVDVTTPHPFGAARAREMSNGRRLRIVHDVQIVVVAERLRTPLVDLEVAVLLGLSQSVMAALQCVMKRLGDGKKIRFPVNQAPVGLHTERLQHRNVARQQLRHSPASGRRIHMTNPDALQTFGECRQFLIHRFAEETSIAAQIGLHRPTAATSPHFR